MSRAVWRTMLGLGGLLAMVSAAWGQTRPYIGFVYPAGGQQGTTFQVQLGGQGLDDVNQAMVTGPGVSAKVVGYYRKIGPQEMTLLREQLAELKGPPKSPPPKDEATLKLIERIEKRMAAYCNRPACASLSSLAAIEVTVAPDAPPGQRELRLATPRGVSNPLVFEIGQFPEFTRKPMRTADFQVLGKEELALRKRPPEEVEERVPVPCTLNGQIASGEVNRYRFQARKGQRLVISAEARKLIPYIADAVPGWFQPVLALYDAGGKEVAFDDDYRFKPDPIILYEVPKDGEYVLTMIDALYRGREDFVYRVTVGELPLVTSIFPLGGRAGVPAKITMKGWNLEGAQLSPPAADAGPGLQWVTASRQGLVSNRLPFAMDTLPEGFDKEPNNDAASAQKVRLPIIVNGRINRPDDWDVFQVSGRAGETIVAEVSARRLESPLDSVLRVTDAAGKLLALNDDHEDAESGVNTHHADSYLMVKLPADGTYYVHLGDTARHGGDEYGYRLRISRPRPDFALRVVPSSVTLRSKSSAGVSVFAIRKDGFSGPIKLALKNPPEGFSSYGVSLPGTQEVARLTVKTTLVDAGQPVNLRIEGVAKIEGRDVAHEAVPAEDRMQAFLWRHLVPAEDFQALVYDPSFVPPPKRIPKPTPEAAKATLTAASTAAGASATTAAAKPMFTKQQVAGRLRQVKLLFEEGLLTDEFNNRKVAECEAAQ